MPQPKKTNNRKSTKNVRASKKPSIFTRITNKKPLLFMLLFAGVGVALLIRTFAATTSITYSGSITPDKPEASYQISTGSGTLTAKLTPKNSRNNRMRVTMRNSSGEIVKSTAVGSGNKSATVSATVTPDTYSIGVSWDGDIESKKGFTLAISYPTKEAEMPAVIITSPTSDELKGIVNINATVKSSNTVQKVEFYIDNQIVATDTSSTYGYQWDTTTFTNGEHSLVVKAYDANNGEGQATLTVMVNNPVITQEPTPDPNPVVPTTPPQTGSSGIWISQQEIMALPMSGPAWENVKTAANASWGIVNLADNNSLHDTYTLAGALVSVRTGDVALKEKTRQAIMSVSTSGYTSVLPMSRNITSYVIAADIIDLSGSDDVAFREFISSLRTKPLTGHSGGKNLRETALFSSNNWGTMARAAMSAIDTYLGDAGSLNEVANAHRVWLGESIAGNRMIFTSTNWHVSPKVGINPRGATIQGQNVDGVQPEDQRRTSEFMWPAPKGSYPWEALQGGLVAATILHRSGIVPITAGDDGIYRATNWLVTTNANPATGDDRWQPWLLNKIRGTSFTTETGVSAGKNMGWTDWTHTR